MKENDSATYLIRVGKKITDVRLSKKFTQETLAFESEIDVSTLSRIERGKCNFTIEVFINICNTLDTNPKDIFDV